MICHDIEADIEKMHSTEEPDTVSDRSLVGYGIGIRTKSEIERLHSIEEEREERYDKTRNLMDAEG